MTASTLSSPLRISIVQGYSAPVPAVRGGAVEKAWYAFGREFARRGHHVTHIGRTFAGLAEREIDAGVTYLRVPGADRVLSTPRHWLRDLRYTLHARRALPPGDILVSNTLWLPVVERRASRGVPYLHVARYPKGQLKVYPRRCVFQTVSGAIRDAILAEVPGSETRTRIIPYALSSGYFQDLNPVPEPVILYTGRIHPEKGIHLLIDAFAQARLKGMGGWRLVIIGPWKESEGGAGPGYRDSLQARAAAAGAEVAIEEPIFDEARLVRRYHSASVFVYPSLAARGETFGLAALEAMAAGCAPIVSSLGCFRDFVEDGKNGLVFDHNAPDACGQLSMRLLELCTSPARLDELRREASQTARRYRLEAIADQFIEDFLQLRERVARQKAEIRS